MNKVEGSRKKKGGGERGSSREKREGHRKRVRLWSDLTLYVWYNRSR